MERQQIEVFLTLADELHFGRTAERLRLSQARTSQSLKALEAEIGTRLFERSSRRVELTAIGEQLRDDLGPAHAQVTAALERAVAAARGGGTLRVGFLGPIAAELLAEAAHAFGEEQPQWEVSLHETQIADPAWILREKEVDLLVTQHPVEEPGLVMGPVVIRERRLLAVSARHPLAQSGSVSMEVLAGERIFRPRGEPSRDWEHHYQPWETPSGTSIERARAVGTFQELLALIGAGAGVCTVAEHNLRYHPRPDVVYVPIDDAPPFEFGFVWRSASETTQALTFVRMAREIASRRGCFDDDAPLAEPMR